MTGYDAEKSCPRMYKQTDTPAQVQGRRAAQLKTCLPWTVKRSFFNSFFTFYVFLSGFFKEFNINLLKSTTSKLEPLKGLPLLGFWLKLKRATIRQVFFFFFFSNNG